MILEASRITCDHRVSQSASHLTNHTPIACITYHSTTLLLSHITHHASHYTSGIGATGCLSTATQCHPSYKFISKISIEIAYRAPLCAVKRAKVCRSGGSRVRLPLVAVRSEHAVALNERHTLDSTCQVTKQYVAHRVRTAVGDFATTAEGRGADLDERNARVKGASGPCPPFKLRFRVTQNGCYLTILVVKATKMEVSRSSKAQRIGKQEYRYF